MKKKYTHIFFDLDNTLWDFKTNSRHAMQVTFISLSISNAGVNFNQFFEIYSEYNHDLWTAYRKKEIGKKELIIRRFQQTFDALHIKGVDPQEMNDLYLVEMAKQNFLMEGAFEILDYLKAKRYKLFIITNGFREVQHEKMRSSGLTSYFEKVFISEEIKTPKPGREIFEHAIKSANAKKTKSIMVGDDWEVDIIGALHFGIDAIFCSKKATPSLVSDASDYKPTVFCVQKLEELLQIL